MPRSHLLAETFLESVKFFLRGNTFHRKDNLIQSVASVIQGLRRTERDIGRRVVVVVLRLIDTDNLVCDTSGIHIFAQRVLAFEKDFFHARAQDNHLPFFLHIYIIDKTAVPNRHFDIVDHRLRRVHSVQGIGVIFVSVGKRIAPADTRRDQIHFGIFARDGNQIFIFVFDPPVHLHSLVRLARVARPCLHPIQAKVAKVRHDPVLHPVSCPQEDNQHENPPCYGKAGQEGTEFILLDRTPYFSEIIKVKHVPILFLLFLSDRLSRG